ncbi:MAG TPA: selenocysteine-specific translation elongation factor [Halieaceae bacterium]|nr:selenocysteine-specific translation elongation factor [Halieaceae bacterium]
MIVATAGHVDHGKTSLIKALTGVDTDTLAEEKARGLTINLGYAYLPSSDGRVIGFIDVPGHHRFINTMISGVSGIDRALVIIAADDGPMPQTSEHLNVLSVLGVTDIDIVITKIDAVTPERVMEVAQKARELIDSRYNSEGEVFQVSSVTGDGIDALKSHLQSMPSKGRDQALDRGFRLSIDRRFHVSGAGLVVTGTASTGTISVGDHLILQPKGLEVRVRELRANDVMVKSATAGQRVALCLAGKIEISDIDRGDCLVEPALDQLSQRLDVQLTLLCDAPTALKHLSPVKLYIGARRVGAKVALIENTISSLAPGQSSMAQLILDSPISTYSGERFVLRDDSESFHLGGGAILDPNGPQYGKAKPERLTWLRALATGSSGSALSALLEANMTVNWSDLVGAFNLKQGVTVPTLPDMAVTFDLDQTTWITTRSAIASAREALLTGLSETSTQENDSRGFPSEKLIKFVAKSAHRALLEATLRTLFKTGVIELTDGRVHHTKKGSERNKNDTYWTSLERHLLSAGCQIPVLSELQRDANLAETPLKLAVKQGTGNGRLHRINATRYALTETLLELANGSEALAAASAFTVAEFKDHFGIGRKLAVEILEFFDSINFTQRQGNERTIANPKAIRSRLKI